MLMPHDFILFHTVVCIYQDYKLATFKTHFVLVTEYIRKTLEKKYNHFEIIHILMALLSVTLIAHLN